MAQSRQPVKHTAQPAKRATPATDKELIQDPKVEQPAPASQALSSSERPAEHTNAAETDAAQAEAKNTGKADKKEKGGRQFTYIGAGEDSPRVINFMGKQKFVRGELTTVTDPDVIAKLENSATFVEGKADQETLHQIDEDAKAEADRKRAEDIIFNARYSKKHRTE